MTYTFEQWKIVLSTIAENNIMWDFRDFREALFPDYILEMSSHRNDKNGKIGRIYRNKTKAIVYECLGIDNYNEYLKLRQKIHSRIYSRENELFRKIRLKVLERDNHRCVLSGETKELHIHHIDGNHRNNNINNLITLSHEAYTIIHNNTRKLTQSKMKLYKQLCKKQGYDVRRVKVFSHGQTWFRIKVKKISDTNTSPQQP